jgi:hypothetical protein
VSCLPASGSTFPLGTTTVTCKATDAAGNQGTATFTVKVVDTTPPTIAVPANMTVAATSATGAPVTYPLPSATDLVTTTLSVSCTPGSGSTFPLGTTTVTCKATDAAGNQGTATFTVTVTPPVTPPGSTTTGLGKFVAFSSEFTWIRSDITVASGDVGANGALADTRGYKKHDEDDRDKKEDRDYDKRVEVRIGTKTTMATGSTVVGDTVWLKSGSQISNVAYNELIAGSHASIGGTRTKPLGLPALTMPTMPTVTPGTTDVAVKKGETRTLAPGAYDELTVAKGATVIFTGGTYHFSSIDVEPEAKVYFQAATQVRVKGRADFDSKSTIGPHPTATGLRASQIVFYVAGSDTQARAHDDDGSDCDDGAHYDGDGASDHTSPAVVRIGTRSTINANVYAPNGTVWLKEGTNGTGAFIGKHTRVGSHATLTLDSAF